MTKARDNHYVAQWHQKGFIDEREGELLHLKRKVIELTSGPQIIYSKRWHTPAQCFYETDLYSTYFGFEISDEIEQRLFGQIDSDGSEAVRAFLTNNRSEWHKHFQNFFTFLDAQKLRTPKGLDWIKSKYAQLNQNELMREMQLIRSIHCTLWAEGVRELVSAEDSDVKFILSDHPVTVYNYACPPGSDLCGYPNDPDIALKGSQTLFPLDKNRCLILTNLEYAQNPDLVNPLELRTNPVRFRRTWVNTIEFINSRKLTEDEVTKINLIVKSRSDKSIAAGRAEWLYPEKKVGCDWKGLGKVLLPPPNELHRFGGEMYAQFQDGSVHYQDAYGRTTPPNPHLKKNVDENKLGRNANCGCGSGKKYKNCCLNLPKDLRTTWSVLSIRERNLAFCRAIRGILGLDEGKSWVRVRSEISDEQISRIYGFYASLWGKETDIYSMLPKSDGRFRALYTGILDVRVIGAHALAVAPYFDEFLIENPIVIPHTVNPEFSPLESPNSYKYQALKDFLFMLTLEPFIDLGLINLIPSPSDFDLYLLREMMDLAKARSGDALGGRDQALHFQLATEDLLNSTHSMPRDMKVRMLISEFSLTKDKAVSIVNELEANPEGGQLSLLQPNSGGQFMQFRMGPNYEMALFIGQVTGSVIVTDSEYKWTELQKAQNKNRSSTIHPWSDIYQQLSIVPLDYELLDTCIRSTDMDLIEIGRLLKSADNLVQAKNNDSDAVSKLALKASKLNKQISSGNFSCAEIKVLAPKDGFYDNTIQRLLVKSGCPTYDDRVRAIYYVGDALRST